MCAECVGSVQVASARKLNRTGWTESAGVSRAPNRKSELVLCVFHIFLEQYWKAMENSLSPFHAEPRMGQATYLLVHVVRSSSRAARYPNTTQRPLLSLSLLLVRASWSEQAASHSTSGPTNLAFRDTRLGDRGPPDGQIDGVSFSAPAGPRTPFTVSPALH